MTAAVPGITLARSLQVAIFVGLLGIAFYASPLYEPAERMGLRWLFYVRGPVSPPDTVVIITLDAESGARFGQGGDSVKWSRDLHATLLDNLAESGAAVVVMDLLFDRPQSSESDRRFADAAARAGNVLLAQRLQRFGVGDLLANPVPELAANVAALAPFPLPKLPEMVSFYWPYYLVIEPQTPESPAVCHAGAAGVEGESITASTTTGRHVVDAVDAATLPVAAFKLYALRTLGAHRILQSMSESHTAGTNMPDREIGSAAGFCRFFDRLRSTFRGSESPGFRRFAPEAGAGHDRLLRVLGRVLSTTEPVYLNFYGPPMTFRTVRYADIVDPAGSQTKRRIETFRDAVVFVGHIDVSAVDQKDSFRTVYSTDEGVDLSGIEIAATAFANLLEDRAVRQPSPGVQVALVFVFGSVIGLLGAYGSGYWGIGIAILGAGAYVLAATWLFAVYSLWLPLLTTVALQFPAGLIVTQFSKYLASRRQSERYRDSLGKYLPRRAARNLADDGPALGGSELVYGVCLLTDVQEYTPISEGLSPTRLTDLMNAYFSSLEEDVDRYGGDVIRIEGDSLAAVWIVDEDRRDVRMRACLAAIDMSRSVEAFNRAHAETPFVTRIGLLDGEVAIGDIGGSGRFTYNVTGDTMNTTSRIEGLNKLLGTTILCGESTISGLDELVVRKIGEFLLKGKSNPLIVYELVGRRESVGSGLNDLLDAFEGARQLFERGDTRRASVSFQALAGAHPEDGPTRFYADYCRTLADRVVPTPVIRVDTK